MAFVIYVIGARRVACTDIRVRTHLYTDAVCMIEIRSSFSFLLHGFPRLLIPLNLSCGGSVLLSKGLVVTELIVRFLYENARANRDMRLDGFLDAASRQRANKYCDRAILDDCRLFFLLSFWNDFTSARHVKLVIASRKYRWNTVI